MKTRSSVAFGLPAEAVTGAKRRRIRRLAAAWIEQQRVGCPAPSGPGGSSRLGWFQVRFDVATVRAGAGYGATGLEVEVIEGAF